MGNTQNNQKEKEWPGYLKSDGGFMAVQIAGASNGFKDSESVKSKRVGKMLENLSIALVADDQVYFTMWKKIVVFYEDLSKDWNQIFIQNGGDLGSGKSVVRSKTNGTDLLKIANQYPGHAFNLFQGTMGFIKQMNTNPPAGLNADEHERIGILDMVVSTIFNGIMMEDKWFDVVEDTINNSVESAFAD